MSFEELKRRIVRNIILSQATEPLGNKTECTTRLIDSSEGAKLEYFIVSAVNSSWAFYDLVEDITNNRKQPECIFKHAYTAQKLSIKNRFGSKVNYGQIQLLIPLVTSHALYFIENNKFDVNEIAENSINILKNTTRKDVFYLEKFINLGHEISHSHHERINDKSIELKTIQINADITNIWQLAQLHRKIHIIEEMLLGYPLSLEVYNYILSNYRKGILKCSEEIYPFLKEKVNRFDVAADIIVVAFYLVLSSLDEEILFR